MYGGGLGHGRHRYTPVFRVNPPDEQQSPHITIPISTTKKERSPSCLPKVEQLADGCVRVREEQARQLVVVRAGATLKRDQLRQERLCVVCFVCVCGAHRGK